MNTNQIARIAGLVGEPSRAAMLMELMDSRALTARELASAGRVTAQTASRHLSQLVDAGLLTVERQDATATTAWPRRRSRGCWKASCNWR